MHRQRGQARLRGKVGLKGEAQPGQVVPSNANLLQRRILKATLRDLYDVVLEFEIRKTQLSTMSELRLQFSVEKDPCIILTDNDKKRARIVTLNRRRMTGLLPQGPQPGQWRRCPKTRPNQAEMALEMLPREQSR